VDINSHPDINVGAQLQWRHVDAPDEQHVNHYRPEPNEHPEPNAYPDLDYLPEPDEHPDANAYPVPGVRQ
jgi:hypothetical protein